ncbi:unnamed protein product [Lupinus luteus]|uniref:RNase H type-1 domain-containing protein n=1 Tax=Lupinus luteus TaxID=3873 RepID=A0AAV1W1X0_LUPLU
MNRNKTIFENFNASPNQVCLEIIARSESTHRNLSQNPPSLILGSRPNQPVIRWFPLNMDWVKLNAVGAFSASRRLASCAGVVRDHFGSFIFAFAKKLGECSVVQAELWGICEGLRLLQHRGFRKINIESDSACGIQLIISGCTSYHPCVGLVDRIRSIMSHLDQVTCNHTFREANSVVDELAKFGLNEDCDFQLFNVLPSFCKVKLLLDCASLLFLFWSCTPSFTSEKNVME